MPLWENIFGKRSEDEGLTPEEARLYGFSKKLGNVIPPLVDPHYITVWAIKHDYNKDVINKDEGHTPEPIYSQNAARVFALGLWRASGNTVRDIASAEIMVKGKRVLGLNKSHYAGRHNFFVDEFERRDVYDEIVRKLVAEGILDDMASAYYVWERPKTRIINIRRRLAACERLDRIKKMIEEREADSDTGAISDESPLILSDDVEVPESEIKEVEIPPKEPGDG